MHMSLDTLTIFTDGGARGNPGPAASAFVIQNSSGQTLFEQGNYIGFATNNVAEYQGIIYSLTWLTNYSQSHSLGFLTFKLDSLLVVNQLKGIYKVKEPTLNILCQSALSSLIKLKVPYLITHIPRTQNSRADYFVNQALDNR
jgi:ribonuclease HI